MDYHALIKTKWGELKTVTFFGETHITNEHILFIYMTAQAGENFDFYLYILP